MREVAARRGVSPAHVAMAWVAGNAHRNVPIVGAAKTAHLEVAVEALALELDAGERAFLEAPYRPRDEINDQNRAVRAPAVAASGALAAASHGLSCRTSIRVGRSAASASRSDCARCSALAARTP